MQLRPIASRAKASLLYQLDKHLKFPSEVYINMTSNCNANCTFCSYDHKLLKDAQTTTPEDIDKMDWLKYAKFIGLWCGNGEPLMNPHFEDILDLINFKYPRAITHLSTNGILLTPEIANKLDYVNVSLNAAYYETWKRVVRSDTNFHDIIHTLTECTQTKLSISLVMYRDNLNDLNEFVGLGAYLNATVVLAHCMFHSWSGDRKLDIRKSCYFHKKETNCALLKAQQYAKLRNVTLFSPPLFGQPHYICRGTPVHQKMPLCSDPFKRLYLTIDEFGKPSVVVCCSGVYFDIPYDIHDMTTVNLLKIWHRQEFEILRQTVNKPLTGGNYLCKWCKSVDRYAPEAGKSYKKIVQRVKGETT